MASNFSFQAHGKLLLTAEYFILDGALALALPVRFGQTLKIGPGKTPGFLKWQSLEADGSVWFSADFRLPDLEIQFASDPKTAQTLQALLLACRAQNAAFLADNQGFEVFTNIDFPRSWGLGTSSTLVAAVAKWAGADAYKLLGATFGGSGYDIACAFAEGPLLFRLRENDGPEIFGVEYSPGFSEHLFFVFLGKKQDSRAGIRRYRERGAGDAGRVRDISALTQAFLAAGSLAELQRVIFEHEKITGHALGLPRAKALFFSDFPGEIKSLGAWGGDFVLAASDAPPGEVRRFFNEKGFDTFMPFHEMALKA